MSELNIEGLAGARMDCNSAIGNVRNDEWEERKNVAGGGSGGKSSEPALKEACDAFEGMFMSMILKQGLKTGLIHEEECRSSDTLRDYIIEEVAHELGRTETFGISKVLYEQVQEGRKQ